MIIWANFTVSHGSIWTIWSKQLTLLNITCPALNVMTSWLVSNYLHRKSSWSLLEKLLCVHRLPHVLICRFMQSDCLIIYINTKCNKSASPWLLIGRPHVLFLPLRLQNSPFIKPHNFTRFNNKYQWLSAQSWVAVSSKYAARFLGSRY